MACPHGSNLTSTGASHKKHSSVVSEAVAIAAAAVAGEGEREREREREREEKFFSHGVIIGITDVPAWIVAPFLLSEG